MTLHDAIAAKIDAVAERGLAAPDMRLPGRVALKAIAAHEHALLEEFAADWPELFAIQISQVREILRERRPTV